MTLSLKTKKLNGILMSAAGDVAHYYCNCSNMEISSNKPQLVDVGSQRRTKLLCVTHITMATGNFLAKNRLKSRVYNFALLFLARSKLEMYHENISIRLNNVVISIKGNVFLRFEQAESFERAQPEHS